MLGLVKLDATRTHFLGKLPRAQYIRVLQVSAAHVYLTYPFVLSWSLLEAMACAAPIVASRTAPVLEVVQHGRTGVLVDFFSPEAVADAVQQMLSRPAHRCALGAAARSAVQVFAIDEGNRGYGAALRVCTRAAMTERADKFDTKLVKELV
jgi:glycosyltransferase involved in cell wall biosynthesis